jgi:hypothetical protein
VHISVEVLDAASVEGGRTTNETVNLVACADGVHTISFAVLAGVVRPLEIVFALTTFLE